ncbi:MAG: FAD-dependent oxidoreductase, partial [Planctomycetes bacterium]|nr:FAD-dependent oxidoreductase [Planctomycetota bacterium]
TLLIEATGALGGMGTSGLVPAWCPFSDHQKIIYRGLAEKVFTAAKRGLAHVGEHDLDWVPIDPERLKRVYDELVTWAGAEVLFNTMVTGLEMRAPGDADVLVVANKQGLSAYRAKVYVDCSGDADLAAWAGAECEQGGEDGQLQGATHCFMLSNVDDYGYRHGPWLHSNNPQSPIHAIVADDKYPLVTDPHMCNNLVGPGTVGFNAGHLWDVDNTDPQSVSKALIQGRRLAAQIRDGLAEYAPQGFANAHLAATATLLGVRETRRVRGDYWLTAEDLMAFKDFPDNVGRNCYYIDVHARPGETGKSFGFRFPDGKSHGIPYRALTPKGLRNLLVAGRTISSDRAANGSLRVMPVCLVTGEAAGAAAALAAKGNGDVHAVNVPELQRRLTAAGAYLYAD